MVAHTPLNICTIYNFFYLTKPLINFNAFKIFAQIQKHTILLHLNGYQAGLFLNGFSFQSRPEYLLR